MNKNKMAKKLICYRADRSRDAVANDIGISISALAMYETGKRIPRDEIKIKFAKYYNTTVEDIFFNYNDTLCEY